MSNECLSKEYLRRINRDGRVSLPCGLLRRSGMTSGDSILLKCVPEGIIIRKAEITPAENDISNTGNDMNADVKDSLLRLCRTLLEVLDKQKACSDMSISTFLTRSA